MTTQAVLDPREARPLTSREISKVLCAIIGGVIIADPKVRPRVPAVLGLAKTAPSSLMKAPATWEVALAATVSGFRGWCDPKDVDNALDWVDQNLPLILGNLTSRLPS